VHHLNHSSGGSGDGRFVWRALSFAAVVRRRVATDGSAVQCATCYDLKEHPQCAMSGARPLINTTKRDHHRETNLAHIQGFAAAATAVGLADASLAAQLPPCNTDGWRVSVVVPVSVSWRRAAAHLNSTSPAVSLPHPLKTPRLPPPPTGLERSKRH